MSEPVEIKLVVTRFVVTRLGSCPRCTGCNSELAVAAEVKLPVSLPCPLFCQDCLETGKLEHWLVKTATRLEADARVYEASAQTLRSAFVVRLPSPEQWQAKIEQSEIRYQAQERLREYVEAHKVKSRDDVARVLVDSRFIPVIDEAFEDWQRSCESDFFV
jgi:hypothetical protein